MEDKAEDKFGYIIIGNSGFDEKIPYSWNYPVIYMTKQLAQEKVDELNKDCINLKNQKEFRKYRIENNIPIDTEETLKEFRLKAKEFGETYLDKNLLLSRDKRFYIEKFKLED